jgi:hypothetical protein
MVRQLGDRERINTLEKDIAISKHVSEELENKLEKVTGSLNQVESGSQGNDYSQMSVRCASNSTHSGLMAEARVLTGKLDASKKRTEELEKDIGKFELHGKNMQEHNDLVRDGNSSVALLRSVVTGLVEDLRNVLRNRLRQYNKIRKQKTKEAKKREDEKKNAERKVKMMRSYLDMTVNARKRFHQIDDNLSPRLSPECIKILFIS